MSKILSLVRLTLRLRYTIDTANVKRLIYSYSMVFDYTLILLGVIFVWLGIVTFFLWRTISHYNNLTEGVSARSMKSVLESLLKDSAQSKKDLEDLIRYCAKIERDQRLSIQKVGLVRFNPFKDTGGDQSFILSLLDGKNSGVVISGLYSRSGTRWYAKRVKEGEGVEYELSEEEKKALKEAEEYGVIKK